MATIEPTSTEQARSHDDREKIVVQLTGDDETTTCTASVRVDAQGLFQVTIAGATSDLGELEIVIDRALRMLKVGAEADEKRTPFDPGMAKAFVACIQRALGIDQAQGVMERRHALSGILNISVRTIARWEAGDSSLSFGALTRKVLNPLQSRPGIQPAALQEIETAYFAAFPRKRDV